MENKKVGHVELGHEAALRRLISRQHKGCFLVLNGPPGCGKTWALHRIFAGTLTRLDLDLALEHWPRARQLQLVSGGAADHNENEDQDQDQDQEWFLALHPLQGEQRKRLMDWFSMHYDDSVTQKSQGQRRKQTCQAQCQKPLLIVETNDWWASDMSVVRRWSKTPPIKCCFHLIECRPLAIGNMAGVRLVQQAAATKQTELSAEEARALLATRQGDLRGAQLQASIALCSGEHGPTRKMHQNVFETTRKLLATRHVQQLDQQTPLQMAETLDHCYGSFLRELVFVNYPYFLREGAVSVTNDLELLAEATSLADLLPYCETPAHLHSLQINTHSAWYPFLDALLRCQRHTVDRGARVHMLPTTSRYTRYPIKAFHHATALENWMHAPWIVDLRRHHHRTVTEAATTTTTPTTIAQPTVEEKKPRPQRKRKHTEIDHVVEPMPSIVWR